MGWKYHHPIDMSLCEHMHFLISLKIETHRPSLYGTKRVDPHLVSGVSESTSGHIVSMSKGLAFVGLLLTLKSDSSPSVWWLQNLEDDIPSSVTVVLGRESFIIQLHPGKFTWNLKITTLKKKINKLIFQSSIIMFHVNFPGCIFLISCFISCITSTYLNVDPRFFTYTFSRRCFGPFRIGMLILKERSCHSILVSRMNLSLTDLEYIYKYIYIYMGTG